MLDLALAGDPGCGDDEHLGALLDERPARARGSAGRSRSSARAGTPRTSTTTRLRDTGADRVGLAVAERVVEVDLAVRRQHAAVGEDQGVQRAGPGRRRTLEHAGQQAAPSCWSHSSRSRVTNGPSSGSANGAPGRSRARRSRGRTPRGSTTRSVPPAQRGELVEHGAVLGRVERRRRAARADTAQSRARRPWVHLASRCRIAEAGSPRARRGEPPGGPRARGRRAQPAAARSGSRAPTRPPSRSPG